LLSSQALAFKEFSIMLIPRTTKKAVATDEPCLIARLLAYVGLNIVVGALLGAFVLWRLHLGWFDWSLSNWIAFWFALSIPPLVATPILMLAYHLVMKGIPAASRKGRRARLVTFAGFAAFLLGSIAYTMVFSLGFGIPV
jgi:hypothetical protein